MEKVPSRRRDKHADSLEDSASASGRILSYQRLHSDSSPKAASKGGACPDSTTVPVYTSRARQRARNAADPEQKRNALRSADSNAGCSTLRPRLSSTSLHQIHHVYNQHPSFLDHHERTRQWLDSAEHPAVVAPQSQVASVPEPSTARIKAAQQQQRKRHVNTLQPSTGCFSIFSCFSPHARELQQSSAAPTQ